MFIGPVELAAAGVAIALFNQASRITIFPLVSITTSFVAEEDTIQNMNTKKTENDDTKLKQATVSKDHMVPDIENDAANQNVEAPKQLTDESNNVVAKIVTGSMDTNNENGTFSLYIHVNLVS